MEWKTRLTELVDIEYPIIQGAFVGFGNSKLAVPVSEAGGLGMITAGALKTPENLRKDIRRARSLTDKPVAVNLTVGMCPKIDEMREVAVDEGVPVVETSGFKAAEHGKRLKEAGIVWIHKVATIEHAVAAAEQGVDAVVIVGMEGTGFKSVRQLPLSICIPLAARRVGVPVIAGGGLGSGQGLAACLALGADGIYMGTAFMATKECPIPEHHKKKLVELSPSDPQIRDKVVTPPDPEKLRKVMAKREKVDQDKWLQKLELVMLKESEDAADEKGSAEELETAEILRLAPGSLAVGFIDAIRTAEELIHRIIKEAEEVLTGDSLSKGI